ncbi:UDP-N-acetylmuramate dehydrogenase [Spirochaetia bacterium 38H-sp]|uniref:UDP-N-acetylenolpyruvoylglucosamine reductase n=1 Tax=Rarispira pelagica TaxID=3141764 RepID=A0ABU9UDL8_9SPIR
MVNVRKLLKKINISSEILFDEPMSNHTSFKVGGPADAFAEPADTLELIKLINICRENNIPLFILGGGANIVVSDRGIRGLVISTTRLCAINIKNNTVECQAGISMEELVLKTTEKGLGGIEDFAWMPGSLGGSIRMNARCYNTSISDVLESVIWLDMTTGRTKTYIKNPSDFAYKISPFQKGDKLILQAKLALHYNDKNILKKRIEEIKQDREKKGHFFAPSAGSVFKNNRDFGQPTGVLIDNLGLKGYSIGDAQVSPFHGNIIINRGQAKAEDIKRLIEYLQEQVYNAYGFTIEPEVIFAGDWD